MEETLSKDEVDALLAGVDEGQIATAAGAPLGGVRPFDLVREERGSRAHAAPLALVHDRFARQLGKALAQLVGAQARAGAGDRDVLRFAALRERIAEGACVCWIAAPGGGKGLVTVPAPVAFELVDRVFGGPGRVPPDATQRSYSATETQTVAGLVQRILDAFAVACAPVADVRLVLDRSGDPHARLTLADPGELVLALELQCDLGAGAGTVLVALPREILAALSGDADGEVAPAGHAAPEWARAMHVAVHGAEVSITAELGSRDLPARDVLRLRVGDVLPLHTRADEAVVVRVEGKPLLRAVAGVSRGQNAVRIVGLEGGE